MTDLDMRGRDAAGALRTLVDQSIDESMIALAFEQVTVGQSRVTPIGRSTSRVRRVQLVAILATAAALLLVVLLVVRRDDKVPVDPPPGPTTSTTTPPSITTPPSSTTPVTTPQPDRGTTSLASIGPTLGFGPYPPQVIALPDGRVLKLAGSFGDPNTLDVLDPTTGEVTTIGTTLVGRSFPAMVLLDDGRLLIAGGDIGPIVTTSDGTTSSPADVNTGEVFDFTTGVSTSAGPMIARRYMSVGATLPDGTVLIVGNDADEQGLVENPVAELYDPATNAFRRTGDRTITEQPTELFPMDDGRVLLFGMHPEIYDPTTGTFTATPASAAEQPTSAVMLQDGTVLSIQGYCSEVHTLDANGLSEGHPPVPTERFDPRTGEFMPGPDLPHCVTTAATMPDGDVFLAGYWWSNTGGPLVTPSGNDDEQTWSGVLDPSTGLTTITPNPTRRNPTAVVTADDRVLLIAGVGLRDGALTWADVYP